MPYTWGRGGGNNPIRPEELTSTISVYSSFQRNFLGFHDSIMKFLFVLCWKPDFRHGWSAAVSLQPLGQPQRCRKRPTHHPCDEFLKKALPSFCHNPGWDETQKRCHYFQPSFKPVNSVFQVIIIYFNVKSRFLSTFEREKINNVKEGFLCVFISQAG